jgi:hypothetical protein|tara:strand:- start:678 stop:983 length:306 start_codon:yes stop_codon:yes gene_type:complete
MLSSDNMSGRIETLEQGVANLDSKVSQLDDKVAHVIQMNSEMMIQSNENFRTIHHTLESNREELKKSIRKIRSQYTSRFQLYLFGSILAVWTLFVAYVLWS